MSMIDFGALGRNIKNTRKAAGKTQDHLAELLGVSVGYVSQIERGATKVSLSMLFRIAEALGCEPERLICGSAEGQTNYLNREMADALDKLPPEKRRLVLRIAEFLGEE